MLRPYFCRVGGVIDLSTGQTLKPNFTYFEPPDPAVEQRITALGTVAEYLWTSFLGGAIAPPLYFCKREMDLLI
jgi:hypothetical protein